MTARLKRREMATAHVHLVSSRTTSAESPMIAKHANDTPRELPDPVDRRLRNLIIAGNAIVWIAIITALFVMFSL